MYKQWHDKTYCKLLKPITSIDKTYGKKKNRKTKEAIRGDTKSSRRVTNKTS